MQEYKVTAWMKTKLEVTLEAKDETEALQLAKQCADMGQMAEVEGAGCIDDWQAAPIYTITRPRYNLAPSRLNHRLWTITDDLEDGGEIVDLMTRAMADRVLAMLNGGE